MNKNSLGTGGTKPLEFAKSMIMNTKKSFIKKKNI